MKESLLKLAKLLAQDEKFLKEFSSKKSVEEQYDFAQKSVKGYTKEEFVKFLDELEKSYELKSDISPEEMEKVSGGANAKTKAAAMAMLALSAVGSAAPMLTGAMKSAVPRGGVHQFFAANDDDDIVPLVVQPSTIGDPVVDVEVSAVMRANAEKLGTIRTQMNDDQLALFASAEACKDTGVTRKQEVERMKNLAQNLETKSAMLNMIKQTYESEKAKGINWVHCPGRLGTGYKLEDTSEIRAKLGDRHQGRIINWLLNKFREGYYLYFEGNKLVLKDGGPRISLEDDIASYSSEVNTDAGYISTFIKELTQRLNRARVFGQSLKAAGMEVEGQWVMRDEGTAKVNDVLASNGLGILKNNMDRSMNQFSSYENCSDKGSVRNTFKNEIEHALSYAPTKIDFLSTLNDQLTNDSLNWIRNAGKTWTGWQCKIKLNKMDEMKESAERGDARAQVLLWLNAKFNSGEGLYLYFNGKQWGLTSNWKFTNFDAWLSDFLDYSRRNGYDSNDGKFKEGYAQVIKETNYHRALSAALKDSGMTVEANAVMAGTA